MYLTKNLHISKSCVSRDKLSAKFGDTKNVALTVYLVIRDISTKLLVSTNIPEI